MLMGLRRYIPLRARKGFKPEGRRSFLRRVAKTKPLTDAAAERFTVTTFGRNAGKTATGELALFRHLYNEQGGKCAVTGLPLLPPSHPEFYKQGSHLLPKGSYKRARLWPDNVIMILVSMHDRWGATGNKWELVTGNDKIPADERWRPYVSRYHDLRFAYNTGAR